MKKKEKDEENIKDFLFYAEAFIQQWATLCGLKLAKDEKAEERFKDTVLYAEIVKETKDFDIHKKEIRKIMDRVFNQLESRKEFEGIPKKLKKIRNKIVHEYIEKIGIKLSERLKVEDSVSVELKYHGKTVSSMSYEPPKDSKKAHSTNKSNSIKFLIENIDVATCEKGLKLAEEFVKKCKEEVEKILQKKQI